MMLVRFKTNNIDETLLNVSIQNLVSFDILSGYNEVAPIAFPQKFVLILLKEAIHVMPSFKILRVLK